MSMEKQFFDELFKGKQSSNPAIRHFFDVTESKPYPIRLPMCGSAKRGCGTNKNGKKKDSEIDEIAKLMVIFFEL